MKTPNQTRWWSGALFVAVLLVDVVLLVSLVEVPNAGLITAMVAVTGLSEHVRVTDEGREFIQLRRTYQDRPSIQGYGADV